MKLSTTIYCLTVLNLVISTTYAQNCPRGSYLEGDICKLCPAGSFSTSAGSTSCELCPTGTYNPFRGGKSNSNCLRCPSDTFSPTRGAKSVSSCKPCPPGSYSQFGFGRCLRCEAGFGLNIYGMPGCEKCGAGLYSNETMKFCTLCPSGKRANKAMGATQCVPCGVGTFRDMRYISSVSKNGWRCDKCPINTYTNKTHTQQCALCPLGTVAGRGSTRCEPCPRNTFRGSIRRTKCGACPIGTVSEPGSAACKKAPKGCPFDTFEDESGSCRACLPGEKRDPTNMKCVRCSSNEVSRGGDTTTCMKCPMGKEPATSVQIFERSQCVCKLGTTQQNDGSCTPCPAGTRGTVRPAGALWSNFYRYFEFRKPICTECTVGSTSSPGSAECTACPAGEIGTTAFTFEISNVPPIHVGPAFCAKCPTGTVPDRPLQPFLIGQDVYDPPTECLTKKDFCEIGKVRNDNDRCERKGTQCKWPERLTSFNECSSCDSAQYWNTTLGYCRSCPEGSVNEATKPQTRTRCTVCQNNAELFEGKCKCKVPFVKVGKLCKRCPGELAYRDGKCVLCQPGMIARLQGRQFVGPHNICSLVCSGDNIFSEPEKKCVPCPAGFKKMRDVVGNYLNKCAPVDPYA